MLTIGDYTILQWMVIFMSYCILGWVFESVYCSLKEMKLINRGFCHGPWLPLYGTGASLLILVAWPYHENLFLVYLVGFFGGTALELLTGVVLYKIFNMRWWDYTQNPFNFKGYICLYASIAWGFLAVFIVTKVHPHVAAISRNWSYSMFLVINTMLYTLFTEDVIFSIIGAFDIKARLRELTENSEEIERLRTSILEARLKLDERSQDFNESIEGVKLIRETEGNMAAAKAVTETTARAVTAATTALSEEARDRLSRQIENMEARLSSMTEKPGQLRSMLSWWVGNSMRNNPAGKSIAHFEELKERTSHHLHKKE
jgi:uncharacterized membrane protein